MRSDCAMNGLDVARLCRANCAMVTLGLAVVVVVVVVDVVAMTLKSLCKMLAAATEDIVEGFLNGFTVVALTVVVLEVASVCGAASLLETVSISIETSAMG